SVPDQGECSHTYNLLSRQDILSERPVLYRDKRRRGHVRVRPVCGRDSDIIALDCHFLREFSLGNVGPAFDVLVPYICRLSEIVRQPKVALLLGKLCSSEQCSYLSSQCEGRVAAVLLPPVLLSNRSVPGQICRRPLYHRPRVETR